MSERGRRGEEKRREEEEEKEEEEEEKRSVWPEQSVCLCLDVSPLDAG